MLPVSPDISRENRTQVVIGSARRERVIVEGDFATFHDATVGGSHGAAQALMGP